MGGGSASHLLLAVFASFGNAEARVRAPSARPIESIDYDEALLNLVSVAKSSPKIFETNRNARKLATAILNRTEQRFALGLDSGDRLFPSQEDAERRIGNLIALALAAWSAGEGQRRLRG
jgi:hypothetical protein